MAVVSAVVLFAAGGAACSAVLGLDPPHLDPCAGGCPDATAPPLDAQGGADGFANGEVGAAIDAAPDAGAHDATPDRGPIVGVRCGGGSSPAIGCNAPTAVCCFTTDDAGGPVYSCVGSAGACTGYPIGCATYNDCNGSDVCCHYQSAIKCEPTSTCTSTSLVCDPAGPTDQCPAGWKCSVAFVSGNDTLPYYGCTP